MITELCPICKGVILNTVLACIPPIHKKTCQCCGKSWTKREENLYETFNPTDWEQL